MTKQEKQYEYSSYIKEHITNVRNSYNKYEDIFFQTLNIEVDKEYLRSMIYNHDASKWSDDEYDLYQRHFFPCSDEDKISEFEFNKAWLHHIHHNPHHPEHWVFNNYKTGVIQFVPMPNHYIIEMMCDWLAMGIKFNNSVHDWYNHNKYRLPFHEDTRIKVEKLLYAIKAYDEKY